MAYSNIQSTTYSGLLTNSNVKTIISNNATIVNYNSTNTNNTNNTNNSSISSVVSAINSAVNIFGNGNNSNSSSNKNKYYSKQLNTKITDIPKSHVLYPGVVNGSWTICSLLGHKPVSIVDGTKLSGAGATFFNNAKVWHNHQMSSSSNPSVPNGIYELVYYNNTYFYRLKGQKANEKNTNTYTYTFINTGNVNDEDDIDKINKFIQNNVYEKVIIGLNMDKNLCDNRSICYLKFDFYINDLQLIYKTIYVKYENSTGLLSKELYLSTLDDDKEKTILQNGFIKITAYQLSDLSDPNPYIFGKFKFRDCTNKFKHTSEGGISLYRFINIGKYYSFSFDDILIYPISVTNEKVKDSWLLGNQSITFLNGQLVNNNILNNIIYPYVLDFNHIDININALNKKSIIIYIDNNEIWTKNYDFYCNITFYLKNGNTYIMTHLLFNKLNNQLILNELVKIEKNKFSIENIIKFSITYIGYKTITKNIVKLNNIKLSKQGNIINN